MRVWQCKIYVDGVMECIDDGRIIEVNLKILNGTNEVKVYLMKQ